MNSMLTLEEVKQFLSVDQDQLEKLIKQRKLQAYKIGGTYLRFRKEDIITLRSESRPQKTKPALRVSLISRMSDFWRFNNFYIISLLLVGLLAFLVIRN